MPARLSIAEIVTERVEVDLWGDVFVRVPPTQPRLRKINEGFASLEQLETLAADEEQALDVRDPEYPKKAGDLAVKTQAKKVEGLGKLLDLMLAPLDESVTATPSTLLKEHFKAGDITFGEVEAFLQRVGEAAQDRPT